MTHCLNQILPHAWSLWPFSSGALFTAGSQFLQHSRALSLTYREGPVKLSFPQTGQSLGGSSTSPAVMLSETEWPTASQPLCTLKPIKPTAVCADIRGLFTAVNLWCYNITITIIIFLFSMTKNKFLHVFVI